ncbi:MAG: hydrogenase maturation protease [Candidatus Glassbacteria bacterium]|nr:hydrogenase maturation protease [Candidatus Glassbacteria bacterium]
MRVLVIGIGNPGRTDDGLGPALVEAVESWSLPGIKTTINYQLNIEDAADVAESDLVIFVDASVKAGAPFDFYQAAAAAKSRFTTHAMEPESVLALCRQVYHKEPPAFILGVRGESFELAEGISEPGKKHCQQAERFLRDLLNSDSLLERCRQKAAERRS